MGPTDRWRRGPSDAMLQVCCLRRIGISDRASHSEDAKEGTTTRGPPVFRTIRPSAHRRWVTFIRSRWRRGQYATNRRDLRRYHCGAFSLGLLVNLKRQPLARGVSPAVEHNVVTPDIDGVAIDVESLPPAESVGTAKRT